MTARAWCFTLNNWHLDGKYEMICNVLDECRYAIFGFELAPTTGTYHIQGFVYFDNVRTFQVLRDRYPGVHWEVKSKRSTHEQAINYCKKDGDFQEFGDMPHQGRVCMDRIEDAMRDPPSDPHTYMIYRNVYAELHRPAYGTSFFYGHHNDNGADIPGLMDHISKEVKHYLNEDIQFRVIFDLEELKSHPESSFIWLCYEPPLTSQLQTWAYNGCIPYRNGYQRCTAQPKVFVIMHMLGRYDDPLKSEELNSWLYIDAFLQ